MHMNVIVKWCSFVFIFTFKHTSYVFSCLYCWLWTSKWWMEMLCVHFNNVYTNDHQWLRTSDKNTFIFTVAFRSFIWNILNNVQNKNFVLHKKQFYAEKNSFMFFKKPLVSIKTFHVSCFMNVFLILPLFSSVTHI